MYGWIWRKLPYTWPGRVAGLVVFLGGVLGVLWYGVFPIVDRHLPNNGVQVTQQGQDTFTAPPTPTGAPSTPPVKLPK